MPPSPPFRLKIWQYNKADKELLQRSLSEFPWRETLNSNTNPNWEVATFNTGLLNTMPNFIPNRIVKIDPKDPPWITHNSKNMIKRQNRMYKNYKRHGYLNDDKVRVDKFREDCNLAVQTAKVNKSKHKSKVLLEDY